MWLFLYHLLIFPLFLAAMRIAAFRSDKIRRMLRGKGDWRRLARGIAPGEPGAYRVHVHAASTGEFEQAKPIIEALRRDDFPYRITASFFSPSGYEQQRGYSGIEGACYLPHDRQGEMSEFLNWLSPDLIIIVRYDLWLELLRQARLRGIPVVLICGVLRDDSARFLPVIQSFFRGLYSLLTSIHCVGEEDRKAFERLVPAIPTTVSGDTRYDRVAERASIRGDLSQALCGYLGTRRAIVAGSTWKGDEELLARIDTRGAVLVIVPHEPTSDHVSDLLGLFDGARALSQVESEGYRGEPPPVLIVDRVGALLELYRIGALCYVGGGFDDGVHSVLEPAAHGAPTICGPRVERSRDAVEMRERGVLRVVRSDAELQSEIDALLFDETVRLEAGEAARRFVADRSGATARIIDSLRERALLPPGLSRSHR